MISGGIYQIRHLESSKIYVGSAVSVRKRELDHFNELRKNKHSNSKLQRAFNKYGENAFKFEVLELVEDKTKLLEREQYWLDITCCCNRNKGYNLCKIAGNRLGVKHSEETKCKIAKANTGYKPSEESKRKMAKAKEGKIPWNKGKKMSSEFCEKASQSLKRRHAQRKIQPARQSHL